MCHSVHRSHDQEEGVFVRESLSRGLLHFGSTNPVIRMYILMLDTRNEEQTNDVRMYIEEYLF